MTKDNRSPNRTSAPPADRPWIILIAGPYRSGTDGDAVRMEANLRALESNALPLYEAGHIPMIGEWVALPIARAAGSRQIGDAVSEQFLYPVASRLLERCDAVLRVPGASKGADEDVRIAHERGLPVYYQLADIPRVVSSPSPCSTAVPVAGSSGESSARSRSE